MRKQDGSGQGSAEAVMVCKSKRIWVEARRSWREKWLVGLNRKEEQLWRIRWRSKERLDSRKRQKRKSARWSLIGGLLRACLGSFVACVPQVLRASYYIVLPLERFVLEAPRDSVGFRRSYSVTRSFAWLRLAIGSHVASQIG
jgi:hypothetical protein